MLIYIYQSHILLRKVWSHGMTDLIPYFLLTDKTSKGKLFTKLLLAILLVNPEKKLVVLHDFAIYMSQNHIKVVASFYFGAFKLIPWERSF